MVVRPFDPFARAQPLWCFVAIALAASGCGGSHAPANGDASAVDTAGPVDTATPDADTAVVAPDTSGDTADAADTEVPDTAPTDTLDATASDLDGGRDGDADADETTPDGDGDGNDASDASACVEGEACSLTVSDGPCRTGRCDAAGACIASVIPGCCTADDECASYPITSACEIYRCAFSQCTVDHSPGCCDAATGCDDAVACTADTCGAATGLCTHCPTGCSCAAPLLVAGFDGAVLDPGFSVSDDTPWDAVTWRVSQRRAVRPPGAAYLGRADCPNYYTGALAPDCAPLDPFAQDGARVRATLVSPVLTLPADAASPQATVWLWSDVEPLLGAGAGEPDVLRVTVAPADGSPDWEVVSSLAVGKRTAGGWRLLVIDLTPWRGRSVRLRFTFDSLDGQANAFEGVYLDELRVTEGCEAGGCCTQDADCQAATGDPCTVARCVALTSGAGRMCALVPAHPGEACAPCGGAAGCEDGDPCTSDTCGPDGACAHQAFCCLRRDVWQDGFEAALAHWAVDDPQPDDGVAWIPSTHAFDGAGAAWFGSPATGTYATGAAVRGFIASPPIQLPVTGAGRALELAFALDLDTEWDGVVDYANPAGVDRLTVTILTVQLMFPIWTSDAIGGTTGGAWTPVTVDLTPWAGQTIQVRFTFDSVDGEANDHGGAWVDTVAVRTTCPDGG